MIKSIHERFRTKETIVKHCRETNCLGITLTMIDSDMTIRAIEMRNSSVARTIELSSNGIRRDNGNRERRGTVGEDENFTIGMFREAESKVATMSGEMSFVISNIQTDREWFDGAQMTNIVKKRSSCNHRATINVSTMWIIFIVGIKKGTNVLQLINFTTRASRKFMKEVRHGMWSMNRGSTRRRRGVSRMQIIL